MGTRFRCGCSVEESLVVARGMSFNLGGMRFTPFRVKTSKIPIFRAPVPCPNTIRLAGSPGKRAARFFTSSAACFIAMSGRNCRNSCASTRMPRTFQVGILKRALVGNLLVRGAATGVGRMTLLFRFSASGQTHERTLLGMAFGHPNFNSGAGRTSTRPGAGRLSCVTTPLGSVAGVAAGRRAPSSICGG